MIKDSPGYHRCRFCKSTFSNEIIEKIHADKDDVYCEICGDIVKRVHNNRYLNPPSFTENEQKTNSDITPMTPRKELKPSTNALNYPIGRIAYDTEFPLAFKNDFTLVISRLICFAALRLEHEGEIQFGGDRIPENANEDLFMSIRHFQDKPIKSEFLTNLRESSQEEFKRYLVQLQTKIQANHDYQEDFIIYLRWLINKVYLIISGDFETENLSNFDRTIYKDLQTQKEFFENKLGFVWIIPSRIVSNLENGRISPEKLLVKELVSIFLEEIVKTAPLTKIKEILRNNGISGHGARGATKLDLVKLMLTRISHDSLVDEVFGWSTTTWTVFKSLGKFFTDLGSGSYTFSDKIFSKKFDLDGNHKNGVWRSDTIEQLIELLESIEDKRISNKKRKTAIIAFREYIQARGLRDFQTIQNKPEWVLTKVLQKVFSDKYGRYISMDDLSNMIIGPTNKGYFRNHFNKEVDFPEFKPHIVAKIESYCRDNLDKNSMDLISTLVATWRKLRNDVAYGAPSTSPKQRDIDLINSIRRALEPLFNKPLNNIELGKFFNKENLFTNVSNCRIYRKFRLKDIDELLGAARKNLIPQTVSTSGWEKSKIAREVLRLLGEFRAKHYLDKEAKMLIRQITYGFDKYGYPLGWKKPMIRKLQTEILWLQQKGRCAISGELIILGKDRVARHHIEGIKSKSTLKDLVLVLDYYHGEVKKTSVKQHWITTLRKAKEKISKGLPPEHWRNVKYKKAFRTEKYGYRQKGWVRTKLNFWRADLAFY